MASCYSRNRYYQQSNEVHLQIKAIRCGDIPGYSRRPRQATQAWRPHEAMHDEIAPAPYRDQWAIMHECGHYRLAVR
jgi:hypothetical protein